MTRRQTDDGDFFIPQNMPCHLPKNIVTVTYICICNVLNSVCCVPLICLYLNTYFVEFLELIDKNTKTNQTINQHSITKELTLIFLLLSIHSAASVPGHSPD